VSQEVTSVSEEPTADIFRPVFDALPSFVLVVDEDVRILEYNAAASEVLAADKVTVIKQRAGDTLHCVNSKEALEGCGRAPHCKDCIIRNSVMEAHHGNRVVRRRARMELVRDGKKIEFYALITASPFVFRGMPLALLVIEDINELAELHRIIPVCSVCKKLRDDKESWMMVESYFAKNWDVGFTHSYCPECLENEMTKLQSLIKSRQAKPEDADTPAE
jgi:hypothetical protein